jgi:protein gp37
VSDNSRIEWCDATWNVVVGCTKVSPGCDHCYAERDVNRWQGDGAFDTVTLKPERLALPLKWRRPRRIFVNSLSDLFHDAIPDDYIAQVFAVMALTARHTYQVLTKRHARMRSLFSSDEFWETVSEHATDRIGHTPSRNTGMEVGLRNGWHVAGWWKGGNLWAPTTPLPNVWLGVSVETQQWADIRIPVLLDTPAAVRFLSCEPLLGPVDLASGGLLARDECERGIDWVIVGGESGPGARPMHPDWARTLRDQCDAAGIPLHFKQWGQHDEDGTRRRSKHDAGRLLDGRAHDGFPRPGVPA